MSHDDSLALLEAARRGDRDLVERLLIRHLPSLEVYVRLNAGQVLRGREDTCDIVQSVCQEILADIDKFEYRGDSAFRAWLFRRALQKIIDKQRYFKAKKRDVAREAHRAPISDELATCYASLCSPSDFAMGQEALDTFEEAFHQLKAEYREAITLRRIVGLGYEEIAREMERNEGAVRNLVFRGLARLSTLLEEAGLKRE